MDSRSHSNPRRRRRTDRTRTRTTDSTNWRLSATKPKATPGACQGHVGEEASTAPGTEDFEAWLRGLT